MADHLDVTYHVRI